MKVKEKREREREREKEKEKEKEKEGERSQIYIHKPHHIADIQRGVQWRRRGRRAVVRISVPPAGQVGFVFMQILNQFIAVRQPAKLVHIGVSDKLH